MGVAAGAFVARTSPQAAWPSPDTPVQGVLEVQVANLGTWGPWLPPGWRLTGALRTSAGIGGRFGAPEYTGQMRGSGIGVRNFLLGVNVTDGDVDIALQGTSARIRRFSARGGAGTVTLDGENVSKFNAMQRVRRGLVRSFQVTRLFFDMTPEEHVALAVLQREGKTGRILGDYHKMPAVMDEVRDILDTLGLLPLSQLRVSQIAYGQQRLLEIALALALRPKVLLLDEPAAGVPQSDTGRIEEALDRLPADLAVLMIEHDMDLVFRFAKRVIVLAAGTVIFDGLPQDVVQDTRVREAYLGSYAQ